MTERPRFISFSKEEQMLLTKRLALLLRSGVPILVALSLMQDEAQTRSSAHIISSLRTTVASGRPLSAGLVPFQKQFGELGIHFIAVGETSGTLAEHLERLSEAIKGERALRRKVIGALVYPALIVIVTSAIAVLLALYVFPKIVPVFKGFHAALPFSTRALIYLNKLLSAHGLAIATGLLAGCISMILLLRVPRVRLFFDEHILHVPLVGTLLKGFAVARLCHTLGTLIKSNVGIIRAVELCALGTKNKAYRLACAQAMKRIGEGEKISTAFGENPRLFPRLIPQMLLVGESTGSLSESLLYCAAFYEEEIDELSKSIAVLVEPALMLVMGLMVGFVALAIITPIYGITQNLTTYH